MIDILPYLLVIAIRLLVPLLILRRPWWGMLIALLVDGIDLELIRFSGMLVTDFSIDYGRYQSLDKWLDIYLLSIALVATRAWTETLVQKTAVVLFAVRVAGTVLFQITEQRILLLFFPNIFEFFYLFYSAAQHYYPNYRINTWYRLIKILSVLAVMKLGQEYFLHVLEARPWAYLKHDILGWPR